MTPRNIIATGGQSNGERPLHVPETKSRLRGSTPRPDTDVLYSIRLKEKGKDDRTFYKDTPWKGINNGLPGSDPDEDEETRTVLVLNVDADVKDKTNKNPNTLRSWRDDDADFEFGRDAILLEVRCSKRPPTDL
jgi:hypothetical protein